MMNGRISPYPQRNVKADIASALVSSGLLGSIGPELLRENSGLYNVPTKKKHVLPELHTKKIKSNDDASTKLTDSHRSDDSIQSNRNDSPPTETSPKDPPTANNDSPQDPPSPHPPSHPPSHTPSRSSSLNLGRSTPSPRLRSSNSSLEHVDSLSSNNTSASAPASLPHPTLSSSAPSASPYQLSASVSVPPPGKSNYGSATKKGKPKFEKVEDEEIAPTRIPEKYHVSDQSPIRPLPVQEGETLAYAGQTWQKKWFPSERPQGRREVLQLARTFEMMLEDMNHPQPHQQEGAAPITEVEREQKIYDIILHEIIRQVTVECADRGVLLEKVSRRYRRLFSRVPMILSEMQQEIDGLVDANKSLRLLLERLMENKSESENRIKDMNMKLIELEDVSTTRLAEVERNQVVIQQLMKERDEAVEEARRQQERHYYQEKLNSELLAKDEYNKATLISMGKQLEETMNALHGLEAKYLVSAKQQETRKKYVNVDIPTLPTTPAQKSPTETVSPIFQQGKELDESKDKHEEEEEEEEEDPEPDKSRSSATDLKGKKKVKGKLVSIKSEPKPKKKSKEKDKEREDDASPHRIKKDNTPNKKKDKEGKPPTPTNRLRTMSLSRPSARNLIEGSEISEADAS